MTVKSTGPGDQTGGSVVVTPEANEAAIKEQRDQMSERKERGEGPYKPFETER